MKHRLHMMSFIIILFLQFILTSSSPRTEADDERTLVLFWNLENFFDWKDSGAGASDREFSSYGERRWTWKRFNAKCNAIAKTIFAVGEKYGKIPDVIGFAEVENRFVLDRLVYDTLLRKAGYKIVHFDSNDSRGIDTALLFNSKEQSLVTAEPESPKDSSGRKMNTRDILTVILEDRRGRRTAYLVNHHPSKYGGERVSQPRREAVMKYMNSLCDSLHKEALLPVISMGDFNDTPDGPAFDINEDYIRNCADSLYAAGRGTIRYNGKWDLIDMFLTAGVDSAVMEIYDGSFLLTEDRAHTGYKPWRTYSGPRYIGGLSDHLPIVLLY